MNENYNDPNLVVEPPLEPNQPRMPQSVESPQLPVNNMTMEQQIAEAKKFLGVDVLEQELSKARADNLYKENLAEVLSKYPELTKENLETKLSEFTQGDENALAFYKSNKGGLEMIAKNLKDTIIPKEKPDEITDDSETSANVEEDELEKRVKAGSASSIELGEYINKLTK